MGFTIEGYFIGSEEKTFRNEDGSEVSKVSVSIATGGSNAYRVYMDMDEYNPLDWETVSIGDLVSIKCRIYVAKNGKLSIVDGVTK